ncbi:T-cell immunoglobulin and mucin domain-containing protein 4-like [Solea solea]|uniref:T-cell immunoglobulin and mucin domain-containing protein 4-like n=1 Tax=Solea solea TaxID=90069 RepID=UPI00272D33F4|nr:T-cell immunoglobulin and mucin domain-containing protein 4-like [Solea solea]
MRVALLLALLTVGEGDGTKVKGRTGEDVTLPCHYDVDTHGLLSVCWNRGQISKNGCWSLIVEAEKTKVTEETRVSNRYQLLGRLDRGNVSLTILSVTETDSGVYGCRVHIPGLFNDEKHHFDLTVDTALLLTTSTPVDTATSPGTATDAHTSGQMTSSAASAVLTSSSASSSMTSEDTEEVSAVAVALLCAFFGFIGLITVGGVIVIIARKWRQLKVPQPLVSSSLSTLQLQSRGADENIYQMDEGVYDSCP